MLTPGPSSELTDIETAAQKTAQKMRMQVNLHSYILSSDFQPASLLAVQAVPVLQIDPSRSQPRRHRAPRRLAHFPPHLLHMAEGERGGREDRAGTAASRKSADDAAGLYAGGLDAKTQSAAEGNEDGARRQERRRKSRSVPQLFPGGRDSHDVSC